MARMRPDCVCFDRQEFTAHLSSLPPRRTHTVPMMAAHSAHTVLVVGCLATYSLCKAGAARLCRPVSATGQRPRLAWGSPRVRTCSPCCPHFLPTLLTLARERVGALSRAHAILRSRFSVSSIGTASGSAGRRFDLAHDMASYQAAGASAKDVSYNAVVAQANQHTRHDQ